VVKVIVDRNFTSRLNGEISETIFRIPVTIVSIRRKPSYTGADNFTHLPLKWELLDLNIFAVFEILHFHDLLLLY